MSNGAWHAALMYVGRELEPPPSMAQRWAGQQREILHSIAKLQASGTGSMESTGSGAAPGDANAAAAAERAMQELLV
jgi:hypothetical protein